MKIVHIVLIVLFAASLHAESFDTLLESIKKQSAKELDENQKRQQRFFSKEKDAKALLKKTRGELAALKRKSEKLQKQIDTNDDKIALMEETLEKRVGDLGELFGAIRQISGETKADLEDSMISVHYPKRGEFLDHLAHSKALADIESLERLWVIMLEEMAESAKVSKFTAPVIQPDGTLITEKVIRVGTYTAVADGRFLLYSPKDNLFIKTKAQPSGRYLSSAKGFDSPKGDFVKVMIDPTRGQLLNMLSLKPDLVERIRQGGIVGYIIIALAAIGLLLALVRYLYLVYISRKIKKQSRQLDEPSEDNALGRIAIVYKKSHEKAVDQKEVILEEAILKEIPAIERYNSLIKLLAAVSPLLGLLGTVTGMIITFQSITLFGTSDPKLMAGGISTALVTTVLGLSGAIPLLFAYTFIAAKSKSIIDLLEHQSLGLIAKEQ